MNIALVPDLSREAREAAEYVIEASDTFLAHQDGVVVVIEVYMDETGTHDDSQIIGVSTAWADKGTWASWTLEWIKSKHPIRIFHAVNCHNRTGEFKGLTREKRDELVIRLLPVIERHNIRGSVSAIDKGELRRLLAQRGLAMDAQTITRGWYYVCLSWALRGAWQDLCSEGYKNIAFIHEDNDFSDLALEAFKQTKRLIVGDCDATFAFGSKMRYPPLQCADIIAYEGNHQLRKPGQPLRKALQAIDPSGRRFGFRKYDKTEVGGIVDFTAAYLERLAEAPSPRPG
jgi:hypothetical protein